MDSLALLTANPPQGTRVRPLQVAGAFHTQAMADAVAHVQSFAQTLTTQNPSSIVLTNSDGSSVTTGSAILSKIVNQISNPVRWDLCMETMKQLGVTAVIELPPAGTLVGLIKRALPGVETLALKSPDDLDSARDLIERHNTKSEKVGQ
jgi:[acyl-carrier-protein] S-malonyltransferase